MINVLQNYYLYILDQFQDYSCIFVCLYYLNAVIVFVVDDDTLNDIWKIAEVNMMRLYSPGG